MADDPVGAAPRYRPNRAGRERAAAEHQARPRRLGPGPADAGTGGPRRGGDPARDGTRDNDDVAGGRPRHNHRAGRRHRRAHRRSALTPRPAPAAAGTPMNLAWHILAAGASFLVLFAMFRPLE